MVTHITRYINIVAGLIISWKTVNKTSIEYKAGTYPRSLTSMKNTFSRLAASINQSIIERNAQNQIASVLSGGAANIAQIRSQVQNPFLSGLSGAIQGAQTGLAIGGAINSIGSAMQAPNIGGVGGAPSYGGGFGPRTGGFGSPTAFA